MKEVIVKSNKYGINLILDDKIPFEELRRIVAEKFTEAGEFFKDARMAVSFAGRVLSVEEQASLAQVIMDNSRIKIVSIIDGNKDMETLMKEHVEASAQAAKSARGSRKSSKAKAESEPAWEEPALPPVADFYKGNLRSGQTLECASSVTLIGDVNPGAMICSGGNIVVLGSLKGNACAGMSGDSNCFIFALDMRPIQLQIGDLIAKSPDREKASWRDKRKKTDNVQYSAQVALVRDGYICIEPMTKGCLEQL